MDCSTDHLHFTNVGCGSKHVAQRSIAYQYLCTLFVCALDQLAIARAWPLVAPSIRDGLTDAAEAVRLWSRRLFWAMESHISDEAGELYEGLEPLVQERLDDEREHFAALATTLKGTNANEHSPMSMDRAAPTEEERERRPPWPRPQPTSRCCFTTAPRTATLASRESREQRPQQRRYTGRYRGPAAVSRDEPPPQMASPAKYLNEQQSTDPSR